MGYQLDTFPKFGDTLLASSNSIVRASFDHPFDDVLRPGQCLCTFNKRLAFQFGEALRPVEIIGGHPAGD
jgi:hypothetical protein